MIASQIFHDYIVLKRVNKVHLVKAIRELEKRGYECAIPITKGFSEVRGFNGPNDATKGFKNGTTDFYYTKMKKVKS